MQSNLLLLHVDLSCGVSWRCFVEHLEKYKFEIKLLKTKCILFFIGRRAATEHFQKLVFCRSAEMKRVLREDFAAALAVPEAVQACYDHEWEPNYALWNSM